MESLIFFVGSYLVGSIPTAYLFTKWRGGGDIRYVGSGNIGAFNAYVVSHSRWVGLAVGVVDALKGLAVVLVSRMLFADSFMHAGIGLMGAIAGHNYSIWMGFRGGRGLSTAGGGMILLGFSYALAWGILWLLARAARRDILISNLAAILLTPLLLALIPWEWVSKLNVMPSDHWLFLFFSCMLSAVLLLSHQDTVRDVWKTSPSVNESKPPNTI